MLIVHSAASQKTVKLVTFFHPVIQEYTTSCSQLIHLNGLRHSSVVALSREPTVPEYSFAVVAASDLTAGDFVGSPLDMSNIFNWHNVNTITFSNFQTVTLTDDDDRFDDDDTTMSTLSESFEGLPSSGTGLPTSTWRTAAATSTVWLRFRPMRTTTPSRLIPSWVTRRHPMLNSRSQAGP